MSNNFPPIHGTTVLCVRRDNKVVIAADGQVTMGEHVMKHTARKTRRLFNEKILAGFAGSTADALSLFERFEGKLQEHQGNLAKSAVELAKEWRKDRALRHLEALLVVADGKSTFLVSGNGDVIEPDDGICAIGSGGPFALAAARALSKQVIFEGKGGDIRFDSHVLETVQGSQASFDLRRIGSPYVRVRATAPDGRQVWTQPAFR